MKRMIHRGWTLRVSSRVQELVKQSQKSVTRKHFQNQAERHAEQRERKLGKIQKRMKHYHFSVMMACRDFPPSAVDKRLAYKGCVPDQLQTNTLISLIIKQSSSDGLVRRCIRDSALGRGACCFAMASIHSLAVCESGAVKVSVFLLFSCSSANARPHIHRC